MLVLLALIGMTASCAKKDTYGYTCRCKDKVTGASDTIYTINIATSGEAHYYCKDYADTANAYGKNISCDID